MKRLAGPAALLAAAPALAHDGAHLHPHGYESAIALSLMAVALVALAAFRAR